nr:putative reverse transcriptase, RNA-dependent DNA polymerase, Gag-polypeptide of LTR copia-type [Tanacetum cinerariifolium]
MFPFKKQSENKDYEMVSQDTNSLKFFNNFNEETRLDEPYDDNERDRKSRQGEDTNPSSFGATENTGSTKKDECGHPSTPEEVINEEVDGVTHEDDNMSEGDDFYDDFNKMFQQFVEQSNDFYTLDNQGRNLKRSSRKSVLLAKLQDFKLNTSVKYSIDNQVSYSKLSLENFSFSTSINKIREPKTYDEASSDIRWIEAMNLKMKALNRNGTWLITDLLKEERPLIISGVLKLSTSLVEK